MGNFNSDSKVELDKEHFSMQRAYLYAMTIRSDVPEAVKALLIKIEKKLSELAGVKSHHEEEIK